MNALPFEYGADWDVFADAVTVSPHTATAGHLGYSGKLTLRRDDIGALSQLVLEDPATYLGERRERGIERANGVAQNYDADYDDYYDN